MYDMVLIEKCGTEGLCKNEIMKMLNNIKEDNVYPIEIDNHQGESSAMGFITSEYAKKLDYDYFGLRDYIGDILANVELETQSHEYVFDKGKILLTR